MGELAAWTSRQSGDCRGESRGANQRYSKIETVILNGKILDRVSLSYDAKKDPGFRTVTGNFNSPVQ
jgi:hypothetical protein